MCACAAFNQNRTLSGHRHSQISALVSSSLSGCSSICEINDVCVKHHISKSTEVLLQLAVGISEQQTSHSPEWCSTCSWEWISMMSPSTEIYGGRLTVHECHAPDEHIYYGCTSDFCRTINKYTCTVCWLMNLQRSKFRKLLKWINFK